MKLAKRVSRGVYGCGRLCRRSMFFSDCNRGLCFFKIVGGSGNAFAFFALLLCCGYVGYNYTVDLSFLLL